MSIQHRQAKIRRKKWRYWIPDISGLATTTVLNTIISKVENEIHNVSGLVKKSGYGSKITDIEGKSLTTSDCNKFMRKL